LRSLPVSLGERLVRHRISLGLAQKDATLELGVVASSGSWPQISQQPRGRRKEIFAG
jgi:hypothetical protein